MACGEEQSYLQIYGYGTIAIVVISLASLVGALTFPFIRKQVYQYTMLFFMALAVGTLAGDATMHLIPMSLKLDDDAAKLEKKCRNATANTTGPIVDVDDDDKLAEKSYLWKMLLIMLTVHALYVFESLANIFGVKHTHSHGHHNNNYVDEQQVSETELTPSEKDVDVSEKPETNHAIVSISPAASSAALIPKLDDGAMAMPVDFEFVRRRSSVGATHAHLADVHKAAKAHALKEKEAKKEHDKPAVWRMPNVREVENGSKSEVSSTKSTKLAWNFTFGLTPLAFMILLADAVHNFADGIAIGAAFGGSTAAGFSTTIAVFAHELPHELGDFAVLISSGLSVKTTLMLSMFTSVTALIGLYAGVGIATVRDAGPWVFAAVAGVFFYVALVDLIQEVKRAGGEVPHRGWSFLLQNLGIFSGYAIMFVIAVYEEAIVIPE